MNDMTAIESLRPWAQDTGRVVVSGHEAFAPRHGWLAKLYAAVQRDPDLFQDDDAAVLALGIGRNMVRSLRFWGTAFGLLPSGGRSGTTSFADALLNSETGLDPYLDETGTLWRLHWVLCTRANLGAWSVLVELEEPEITRADFVNQVMERARLGGRATERTAANHVDVLLRMYDAATTDEGVAWEDGLGSPFRDLDFLRSLRRGGQVVIAAPLRSARAIDPRSTAFIIADYWRGHALGSTTVALHSMLLGARSPGAVLRLDELGLHALLQDLCAAAPVGTLREDGLGGMDMVLTGADDLKTLEDWAWTS